MSIPQMVKDRAMVTIDARLEPHFSVTSFFLQTSRSSRKLSEFSAKSINFAKKKYHTKVQVSLGDKSWNVCRNCSLIQLTIDARLEAQLFCYFFFFKLGSDIQVYFVESCQNLVRKVLILLRKVVSYDTRVNVSLGDKSLEVFQK